MTLAKKFVLSQLVLASAIAVAQPTLENEARRLSNLGDRAKAIALLESNGGIAARSIEASQLYVYLLTDRQQFAKAISAGQATVKRAPKNAGAHLSLAYAHRHSGNLTEALGSYQSALDLEPGNPDAQIGKVLMLKEMGAATVAYNWAKAANIDLPSEVAVELKYAHAVQLMRQAPADPRRAIERQKTMQEVVELLKDVTARASGKHPDLVAALSRAGQHEEAIQRYLVLQAKGGAPAWLQLEVANSYAALKDYKNATLLAEKHYASNPSDPDGWTALFYLYSDTMEPEKAQRLMDDVVAKESVKASYNTPRALALQVYSRLWASQVIEGKELAEQGLQRYPTSVALKLAYLNSLSSSGQRGEARAQLTEINRLHGSDLDVKLTQAGTAPLGAATSYAESNLQALETEFPGNQQVIRMRRDQDRLNGYGVYVALDTARDKVSSSNKMSVELESRALDASGKRLLLGTSTATQDFNGESQSARFHSFGILAPLTTASSLEARVTSNGDKAGARLQARHSFTDDLTASARVAFVDDAVPSRAWSSKVTSDTAELSLAYQAYPGVQLGLSMSQAKLSDGNVRDGLSASVNTNGAVTSLWSYDITGRAGTDTSSKQDAAYFSPAKTSWAEAEFKVARTLWVKEDHYVTFEPKLSLGLISQDAYGSKPFSEVGIGLRYRVASAGSLALNLGSLHRPYDGEYSTQTRLGISGYWVFP